MAESTPLVPGPEQLHKLTDCLHRFLLEVIETRCVRHPGKRGTPKMRAGGAPVDALVIHLLLELEMTLNPQRLSVDDPKRGRVLVARWPNAPRVGRLLSTLRNSVDGILREWKWEGVCTARSFVFSGAGIDSKHAEITKGDGRKERLSQKHMPSGCMLIKMPHGWRPLIPASTVEDLATVRDGFVECLAWHQADVLQHGDRNCDELVTLSQVAPLTGLSKRTLERHLTREIPPPDFPGGNGKAHKWYWSKLRVALGRISKRTLPDSFPGGRIV